MSAVKPKTSLAEHLLTAFFLVVFVVGTLLFFVAAFLLQSGASITDY